MIINYQDKYLEYKDLYKKIKNNRPFPIILDNINKYIKNINDINNNMKTFLNVGGSKKKTCDIIYEEKLQNYKILMDNAQYSIIYFKNLAEQYYNTFIYNNIYYKQLLEQLKIKKEEINNINNKILDINNNNSLNNDKIDMLESVMKMLENMIQKNKDKININNIELDIKSVLNGDKLTYNTITKVDDKIINSIEKSFAHIGGSNFIDNIRATISNLNTSTNILKDNKKFIDDKLKNLQERMKNIIEQNDELFNIRTKIEFIVNKLETTSGISIDFDKDATQESLIKQLKTITTDYQQNQLDESVMAYIKDLEKYAGLLENSIKANKDTFNSSNSQNVKENNENLKQVTSQEEDNITQKGGNKSISLNNDKIKIHKGGAIKSLREHYNNDINADIIKLFTKIFNINSDYIIFSIHDEKSPYIVINQTDQTDQNLNKMIDYLKNISELMKDPKIFSLFHTLILLIERYELYLKTYIKQLFKYSHFQDSDNNIHSFEDIIKKFISEDDFIKIFGVNNIEYQDFYKNIFKNDDIFYLNNKYDDIKLFKLFKSIDFEIIDSKVKLKNKINIYLVSNLLLTDKIESHLKKTIEKIDNSIIYFIYTMYYLLNKYKVCLETFNIEIDDKDKEIEHNAEITKTIGIISNILHKTYVPISSKKYNLSGGSMLLEDFLTQAVLKDHFTKISTSKKSSSKNQDINVEITNIINKSINTSASKLLKVKLKKEQIDKMSELLPIIFLSSPGDDINTSCQKIKRFIDPIIDNIENLFNKINNKLNQPKEKEKILPTNIDTLTKLYELIKKDTITTTPTISNKSNKSKNLKPRIEPFIEKLIKCRDDIKPYINKINLYKTIIAGLSNFKNEDKLALVRISAELKTQFELGTSNYLKIIPMIFFTTEFPVTQYLDKNLKPINNSCDLKFTYDSTYGKLNYELIDENCTKILSITDITPSKNITITDTHGAFLNSTNCDTTKCIIEDRIIGLKKLIETGSEPSKPSNNIINMMFALGASGTGKTSRYFGIPGVAGNQQGIVPFIIENSIQNKTPKPEVSIAYFVCYGQKQNIETDTETDTDLFETLLFFNINKICFSTPAPIKGGSNDYIIINEEESKSDNITNYYNDNNSNETKTKISGITKTTPIKSTSLIDNERFHSYLMNKETTAESDINYTSFFIKLINKKLQEYDFHNIHNIIDGNSNDYIITDNKSITSKTFREILKEKKIWYTIDDTLSPNDLSIKLSEIFENLLREQKNIYTVLPTKNNIESSRGHTCVLISIEENGKTKYFPLFDMAGTENTTTMKNFLIQNSNKNYQKRMEKLIKIVNEVTSKPINNNVLKDDYNKYSSLNDIIDDATVKIFLNKSQAGGSNPQKKMNGVKTSEIAELDTETVKFPSAEHFIDKIIKEGFYINHTIGMLMFASKCIGSSMNTKIEDGEDKFDDFGKNLFSDMNNIISKNIPDTKTRILLDKFNYNSILNNSCIWLQILFSFLYWNEETEESSKRILYDIFNDEITKDKIEKYNSYLDEITIFKYDGIKIKDIVDNLQKLFPDSTAKVSSPAVIEENKNNKDDMNDLIIHQIRNQEDNNNIINNVMIGGSIEIENDSDNTENNKMINLIINSNNSNSSSNSSIVAKTSAIIVPYNIKKIDIDTIKKNIDQISSNDKQIFVELMTKYSEICEELGKNFIKSNKNKIESIINKNKIESMPNDETKELQRQIDEVKEEINKINKNYISNTEIKNTELKNKSDKLDEAKRQQLLINIPKKLTPREKETNFSKYLHKIIIIFLILDRITIRLNYLLINTPIESKTVYGKATNMMKGDKGDLILVSDYEYRKRSYQNIIDELKKKNKNNKYEDGISSVLNANIFDTDFLEENIKTNVFELITEINNIHGHILAILPEKNPEEQKSQEHLNIINNYKDKNIDNYISDVTKLIESLLDYFKFNPTEWFNDNITTNDFINNNFFTKNKITNSLGRICYFYTSNLDEIINNISVNRNKILTFYTNFYNKNESKEIINKETIIKSNYETQIKELKTDLQTEIESLTNKKDADIKEQQKEIDKLNDQIKEIQSKDTDAMDILNNLQSFIHFINCYAHNNKLIITLKSKHIYINDNYLLNLINYFIIIKILQENQEKLKKKHGGSLIEYNQILRVKQSQSTATNLVCMHLVTGQAFKKPMVEETLGLVKNLYEATDIKIDPI